MPNNQKLLNNLKRAENETGLALDKWLADGHESNKTQCYRILNELSLLQDNLYALEKRVGFRLQEIQPPSA